MNLLLLLSALLSALTGVGGSVRAPRMAQSVAASSIVSQAAPTMRQVARMRPVAALPALAVVARAVIVAAVACVAAIPFWASRRRE